MTFPELGARITVEHNGKKITGRMTIIRLSDETAYLDSGRGIGRWVPFSAIHAKYGK